MSWITDTLAAHRDVLFHVEPNEQDEKFSNGTGTSTRADFPAAIRLVLRISATRMNFNRGCDQPAGVGWVGIERCCQGEALAGLIEDLGCFISSKRKPSLQWLNCHWIE